MIDFSYQTDFDIENSTSKILWIKNVVNQENLKLGEITYVFCNDNYLLEINKKFLDHDTLTDIISFDYSIQDFVAGEIYISVERVKENAVKFGVSFNEELDRVIIHGILHFCGYKDKSAEEALIMRKKEDWALAQR